MRSTISIDCATTRRRNHEQIPGDRCAKQSPNLGCPQGSPVPAVQNHVCKRLVRRADLFALQKFERLAQRRAVQVLSDRQQTLEVQRQAVERHGSIEAADAEAG